MAGVVPLAMVSPCVSATPTVGASEGNGGVADSLDEAKAAFRVCENPIARMTFLSQFCPAPRASKRGAFEPRQNPPKSDAGAL